MSGIWFTSDTHFDHAMVAGLRGFGSKEEHDDVLVANWNAAVRPEDVVWHLGDVGMGELARFAERLDKLHGEIHLVAGNHDACSPIHRQAHKHQQEWLKHRFASIQAYARRRIRGVNVLLSHFPYRGGGDHTAAERYSQYRLVDEGLWLLHGHTHTAEKHCGRQIHVGVDAWNLAPVSINTIADLIAQEPATR